MAKKPSIPKGTRDFSPQEISRRNYIIECIRKHFIRYGFQPIETPSFENLETLMGKYGEEGDRLIFKILNSGEVMEKIPDELYKTKDSQKILPKLAEKALRYDLTVPFARYVVMHQNELHLPFKRYQIQPVWRADRPQKGRFREFYQCDADVVGPASLLQEIEFIQLYDSVFDELKLPGVVIKINHRQLLAGIAEAIGARDLLIDFTVALDKLDKIGKDSVINEMLSKGISAEAIDKLRPLFELQGEWHEQLDQLESMLEGTESGREGVAALRYIMSTLNSLGLKSSDLCLDITLARGLNYYTGAILEVAAPPEVQLGSIGGGGRYDDLTGIFGLPGLSGVGISFGLDRIYLVMEALDLFPASLERSLEVLLLNFGQKESEACLPLLAAFRKNGLRADLYPADVKIQKQMKYANNRNIPYVVLIGEQELADGQFVVKNMETGEQQSYSIDNPSVFSDTLL